MKPLHQPRLLPVDAWPDIDRRLWEAAQDGQHSAGINVAALPAIASGYGRWLSVLAVLGLLDQNPNPGDRVTPSAVKAYIVELRRGGNNDKTIGTRPSHLGSALRIMASDRGFTWLHPRKLRRSDQAPRRRKPAMARLAGRRSAALGGRAAGRRHPGQAEPRITAASCHTVLDRDRLSPVVGIPARAGPS